jgi:hypothetical protein
MFQIKMSEYRGINKIPFHCEQGLFEKEYNYLI